MPISEVGRKPPGGEALEVGKREKEWLESRSEAESDRERYLLGRAYFLTEQLQRAQEIFKELAGNNPRNIEFLGYFRSLAVRVGRRDQANRIVEALGTLEGPYLYGLHIYCRARIESLLGDKAKAVQSLQTAFSQDSGSASRPTATLILRHCAVMPLTRN